MLEFLLPPRSTPFFSTVWQEEAYAARAPACSGDEAIRLGRKNILGACPEGVDVAPCAEFRGGRPLFCWVALVPRGDEFAFPIVHSLVVPSGENSSIEMVSLMSSSVRVCDASLFKRGTGRVVAFNLPSCVCCLP